MLIANSAYFSAVNMICGDELMHHLRGPCDHIFLLIRSQGPSAISIEVQMEQLEGVLEVQDANHPRLLGNSR